MKTLQREAAFVPVMALLALAHDPNEVKRALLVGIADYPAEAGLAELAGCVKDVERMREVLVERFGFLPENIVSLADERATHEGIVRAFHDALIAHAAPGAELVFFFSGHGSRVRDESGVRQAEPDALDSTLVAYDSRAPGRSAAGDIRDDELRSLATAAIDRGAHLLVVTDACHSGGVLREGGERVEKSAPPCVGSLTRPSFWPADVRLLEDSALTLPAERYLHIGACARDQRAFEVDVNGGPEVEPAGALTFFLTRSLDRARAGDSWRTVFQECRARLMALYAEQTPSSEGELDRAVFGGAVRPVPGFAARARAAGVLIDAGALHGLRSGAELEVLDGRGERSLGGARVEELDGLHARARWIRAPSTIPEGALRAVERGPSAARRPLRVRLDDPRLAQLLHPRAVRAAEDAEYRLERRESELVLETAEGLLVGRCAQDEVGELRAVLEGELRWRALFDLDLERGNRPLEVSLRPATETELAGSRAHAPLVLREHMGAWAAQGAPSGRAPLPVGVLELNNPHERDLHVSVLSVMEDRSCALLEFPGGETSVLVPRRTSVPLYFGVRASPRWTLARPMRDRYLVIATRERADFSPLVRSSALRSADDAALAGLPADLRAALLPEPELRGERLRDEADEWGLTALDLLVSKP